MVKKFYLVLVAVIILGIVSSTNALALNIDSCQNLQNVSGTVFTLTQNIIVDSTACFTFQNNSLTLDCQGNTIQVSSNTDIGKGVYLNSMNHSTIMGCRFLGNATADISYAVDFRSPYNMTIYNNSFLAENGSFSTVLYGFGKLYSNSTVKNNVFHLIAPSINIKLVSVSQLSNFSIVDNNMTLTARNLGSAIQVGQSSGDIINHTSIINNNISVFWSSGTIMGIDNGVTNWNTNFTIKHNNITINGSSGTAYAIDGLGRGGSIIDNYVNITGNTGNIAIRGNTDNFFDYSSNIIEGNVINANSKGIELTAGSTENDYNIVRNNTITTSVQGIQLAGKYNFILNNTLIPIGSPINAIISIGNAKNNTVVNNSIRSSLGNSFGYGLQFSGSDQENNTVYNNFFNVSLAGIYVSGISGDFNNFSITKTLGVNIIGGSNLGGNFYPRAALSSETNYAYSCMDSDADGICDISLSFGSNSYDFYPLASVNDVPVFRNNGTSNSAPKVDERINISANFSDDLELDTITLEHNASGGALINVSTKANAVSILNVSFNLTVTATNNQVVAYKFYVNDTRGRTNSSPQAFFIVANTAPAITHQSQFVNLTQHSFNVSATFNDVDGTSDFVNRSITFTSGTCSYLGNKTIGTTGLNLTFNCTGTFPNANSIVISANDSSLSAISTTSAVNVYPNNIPVIISNDGSQNRPTINNTPITTQGANVSWNFADLDNDTITNFQISWFVNGDRIAKAENSRYLTADNFTTDDIIVAGVNISDGFSSSLTVNTTNVTIGDGTPPLILDNFTIPAASVVRDSTIDLFVNATDAKSSISTVTFMVTNPNNVATSHSGTLNSGSSGAGQVSRWTATFTTTTTGTHQVNVTVTDSSSNVARSVQGFLNFTVTAPTSPGSPGGGGGGTDTETIIIEKEAFVGCGDSVCSEGENPSNCFQDCPINVDNLVTCLFSGKECAYSQAWFAQVLIYGLVAGGAYIAIAANKKAKFKSTE